MARGRPLSLDERGLISLGIRQGMTCREIGVWLGRDHTVISREIGRNGGRGKYRPDRAAGRACRARQRPKPRKLLCDARLHAAVWKRLRTKWSPRQISARLRRDYPHDEAMRVSHETIYQTLFVQAKGALRQQVAAALRSGRIRRRPHGRPAGGEGRIAEMVLISQRPAAAADRAVPGFWEGDLLIGKDGASQIATLVERTTRYVLLVRIPGDRSAERVARLLAAKMNTLPQLFKNSITWDQGKELSAHARFSMATDMPVYFCDPHAPWQRGSNENTNGLLRQYFPKGTDLTGYTQAELDAVADELNDRPRETLDFRKPTEMFNQLLLHSTTGALAD